MTKKNLIVAFLCLTIFCLLVSCSKTPSKGNLVDFLEKHYTNELAKAEIKNFQITKEEKRKVIGASRYVIEFTCEVKKTDKRTGKVDEFIIKDGTASWHMSADGKVNKNNPPVLFATLVATKKQGGNPILGNDKLNKN